MNTRNSFSLPEAFREAKGGGDNRFEREARDLKDAGKARIRKIIDRKGKDPKKGTKLTVLNN